MKTNRFSIHRLVVLLSLAVGGAALAAGCVAPPETADTDEDVTEEGPDKEAQSDCCWGGYICPATGIIYEYDTPTCGPGLRKPQAQSICNGHCGPACTDTGWTCG